VAGEYREIERRRLLVFTWLPDWQENATVTVVGWDLVRLTHSGFTGESCPPAVGDGLRVWEGAARAPNSSAQTGGTACPT
jgi:hypothetical protein